MADIKDSRQLLTELREFLRFIMPALDTSQNAVLSNVLLFPFAYGGSIVFSELGRVQDLQILDRLSGNDLDNEASNFALTRKAGTRSRGFITFFTGTAPTDSITIPAGTVVSTVPVNLTQTTSFRTLASRILPGGTGAAAFFNPDTQRYELPAVAIEAVDPGVSGNVGQGRITVLQDSVTGIDGVVNANAVIGGRDRETDDVLRNRVRRRIQGSERNIRKGLETQLLENFDFFDARAVRIYDDEQERSTGIDVFVIDDDTAETTQTFQHDFLLDRYQVTVRPLLSVSSVVGANAGALTEGTHYAVERDVTSTQRFSTDAFDVVRILRAGHNIMQDGELFVVTYSYDNEVVGAQQSLDKLDDQILTANPLVKRGIRFGSDIRATVTFFGGVDVTVEKEKIRFALINFFDLLRLGDPIQGSDIIVVMQAGIEGLPIQSVDQVVLQDIICTDEFGNVRSLSDDPAGETIAFNRKEYGRFDTLTFTTTF